jgi:SAM-dependent methyltransferase
MSVFGNYSRYYDLLYKEKDYSGEANYVDGLIRQFAPQAKTIINLGCGTGAHDVLLSQLGYSVTGVDMSEEMLAIANAKIPASSNLASSLSFHQGDIRTVRLETPFDVVISLFHVMSYQTNNSDFMAALSTAKDHLSPHGIFIFDCWYGPAVLSDRPVVRVKRLEDDETSIVRMAEPLLHPGKNLVDVSYTVFIKDKIGGSVQELKETHTMRYLFTPEIEMMLSAAGFKLLTSEQWMTKKPLGFDTWGALFVCQAI